jgi:hypothetical protein
MADINGWILFILQIPRDSRFAYFTYIELGCGRDQMVLFFAALNVEYLLPKFVSCTINLLKYERQCSAVFLHCKWDLYFLVLRIKDADIDSAL